MNQLNQELAEKKILFSGTQGEALKKGIITQEEIDEWDRIDEEGEKYNEGYNDGFKAGEKSQHLKDRKIFEEMIDKWINNIPKSENHEMDGSVRILYDVAKSNVEELKQQLKEK